MFNYEVVSGPFFPEFGLNFPNMEINLSVFSPEAMFDVIQSGKSEIDQQNLICGNP